MNFVKNISCLVSDPTFGLGSLRIWWKEGGKNISGNKKRRRFIRVNVNFLWGLCISCFIYVLIYYIMTIIQHNVSLHICGISHASGKEFRKYFPQVLESEEETSQTNRGWQGF